MNQMMRGNVVILMKMNSKFWWWDIVDQIAMSWYWWRWTLIKMLMMRHSWSERGDSDAEAANVMILKSDLASNEKSSVGRYKRRMALRKTALSWFASQLDLWKQWKHWKQWRQHQNMRGQWEKRRENCKVWIHQRDPEGNFSPSSSIYLGPGRQAHM